MANKLKEFVFLFRRSDYLVLNTSNSFHQFFAFTSGLGIIVQELVNK